jgi:DNA-directed RNA polymerase specialized sigma24 family protein
VDASVGAMAQGREDERDAVLSTVFRESYAELVGLAALLLDERGLAEEVVQEAFARTYVGWSRVRTHADPLPYLRRAVVNLARGGLRQRMLARRHRLTEPGVVPSAEVVDRARAERGDHPSGRGAAASPAGMRRVAVFR